MTGCHPTMRSWTPSIAFSPPNNLPSTWQCPLRPCMPGDTPAKDRPGSGLESMSATGGAMSTSGYAASSTRPQPKLVDRTSYQHLR